MNWSANQAALAMPIGTTTIVRLFTHLDKAIRIGEHFKTIVLIAVARRS